MNLDAMRWSLAQGEHDGTPVWIRFRQFPASFACATYGVRVNIFWTMTKPTSKGLATPAEDERLGAFEDTLVDAVEVDAHSVLAMVVTAKGKREWVFHTKDAGEFLARLAKVTGAEAYPITHQRYDDATWGDDIARLRDVKPTA